ncbi:MAG: cellulase family glycosylhydrolase [Ruminiclostridium sp.]|nr:cellulase family glycosylhydrolase [Ruminiclostridium sp.]
MRTRISGIFAIITAAVMFITSAVIPVYADSTKTPVEDTEANRFVDSLGAGWNLGNCFDAYDEPQNQKADDMVYETIWCHAKATKELIKTVKSAGFSTIRLPATWMNHVDKNYKINAAWLARYKEVVDWCLDEGLYVIINTHHDVYKGYYYPSSSELAKSKKFMKRIWEQLSAAFKDYDERLIFSSINEPRLRGTSYEWWYPTWDIPAEVADSLECVNKLNQTFVDTVRASGGNNKTRYLLVGGYDTSEGETGIMSKYFKMPTDTAKNRLIADVHYYCSNLNFNSNFLNNLYRSFVAKGIPVVMSEFGLKKDYEEGYYLYDKTEVSAKKLGQIVEAARERGISCIFWDNNYGGKGLLGFKIIDRATAKVELPEIVKAITEAGKPAFAVSSKLTVKAVGDTGKVKLSWNKIDGATKYVVYQYKNGSYSKVKVVTGTSATIKGLHSGRTFKFIVRAYVNGKLTPKSDAKAVSVQTK